MQKKTPTPVVIQITNFKGEIETHEVSGKLVIIRGATDHEMNYISQQLQKAGARLVIYAEPDIKLETLDRKTLNDIGLDYTEKSPLDDPNHSLNNPLI